MNFRQLKTLTLVLLLLCSVCIAPGMAENQQQKDAIQKDIEEKGWHVNESGVLTHLYREFTFCDNSIGGGYRLPDGARILYAKGYTVVWDKAGKLIANISDENAGPWFGPNPNHASAHNAPTSIEAPSGSYIFHEDNGDTTIARDLGKTDIINRFSSSSSETFSPNAKSSAENKMPLDGHGWVTWHEIPITKPITRLSADWSVGVTPQQQHPISNENQAFHTFPGIDTSERILQPVLSWNWIYAPDSAKREPNSKRNSWSISSHICSDRDIHSPSQQVGAPTNVHGEIIYRSQDSTPHWSITTSQGPTKSILNEVEKTTYPNPPGSNPIVVFTLERNPFTLYPKTVMWTRDNWPDSITFKNIVIEPSDSIDTKEARNVVACTQADCKKVDVPKTDSGIGQDVTIQFDKDKNKEDL